MKKRYIYLIDSYKGDRGDGVAYFINIIDIVLILMQKNLYEI